MTKSNTLEQSLKHASHVCRVINVMLTVLLIGAGLIWLTALVMSFAQLGAAGFDGMSLVAYIVLYGVLVLGVLAMLKLIFKDAVNSETPFTEKQADRLRFIAFLALMFALLEFAFTLGVTFEVVPRIGYDVIVNRGSTEPVIVLMLEYSSFLLLCTHFRQYFDMLRCYSNSATKPCKGAAMPIIPRLDRVMADRKMSVNELSQRIDISPVNISRMRRGHIKAVRFSTMERICEVLQCQPGDLFEYVSPEPGTDEAVELDAIINRPIEEPARKPIGAVSRIPVNVAN